MSKNTVFYKQCNLNRGKVFTTVWIPECFAKVGRYIMLKKEGEWDDGWKVLSALSTRMPGDALIEKQRRGFGSVGREDCV